MIVMDFDESRIGSFLAFQMLAFWILHDIECPGAWDGCVKSHEPA